MVSRGSVVRGVSGVSGEGCLRGQWCGVSQGSVVRGVSDVSGEVCLRGQW